jgi:hypothetical protein
MNQTSILGIIVGVVVITSSSVNGFSISKLRSLTLRKYIDMSILLLPPTSPVSSRTRTVVNAISEISNPTSSSTNQGTIDDTIQELLDTARRLGPVGVRNTIEDQEIIQNIVTKLKQQLQQDKNSISVSTESNYTSIPLVGTHDLIYSAAPGGSSGKIGPYFYGKVTQSFVNETAFMNAVDFGPLNIALTATRHAKDNTTFIVRFQSTTISLFGIPLIEKSIRGSGGIWKIVYTGIFHDKNVVASDGNKKQILLRIMETPSLFVIEQDVTYDS